MDLRFQPAWTVPLNALADLFTRAFTGYIAGSIVMSAPGLASMIAQGGIDLNHSLLVLREDEPVGFALMARQGWTSRVAAMGIVPEAQGKQVGDGLLGYVIAQARQRGDHLLELEAFEQNIRAVRLYGKHGFRSLRRLMSYVAEAPQGTASPDLRRVDTAQAALQATMHGALDLPWQVSGSHLVRMGTPFAAYRLDDAYVIIGDPSAETVTIRMVVVPEAARSRGKARRLMHALWATHPDKRWFVPALCPEEYGGFLEQCGFVQQELNQLQMRLDLEGTT